MRTVDCHRPGCYCTLDHQVEMEGPTVRMGVICRRCHHHRLVIGRLRGDL